MIIKELTLHNFGIYAGDNTFRFEDQKPIVLIGGMNGRGKTTFLEAVLIALYGPASFAFLESKSPSYSQYLRSYVNEADGSLESFIRLEFQVDGKDGDIFTITRSWNKKGERSKEKISVSRNGTFNPFLTENWGMFIEELLPSGLSNFFFFDGEKIAELAASNTSEEMKESIKNLLGISALYTLNNDLSRISTKLIHTKNSFNAAELRQIKKEKEELELALSEVDKQSSDLFRKIEHATKQIEKLKQDFTSQGGDLIPKRQSMALEASQLGVEIGNHHDQLVDYASAELPLGLVKDLLADIEKQAMKEKESRSMQDTVDTLAVMMQNYSSSSAEDSKAVQEFIEYVQAQSDESMVPTVFELSDKTLFQIQHIIPSVVENTESVVSSTAQELKKKQLRLNEIQNYLDLDINEDYLQNLLAKIRSKEL
ncbi:MAG: DNA sulfur modification protein DndD, partial [Erysipelotrichaceae bacterium]|nr:DNA sulfur modification protein DndD [Erysipelotrichaceae bacterium]